MAEDAANGTSTFDMTQVDIIDRSNFRGTKLFESYCEAFFSKELDAARAALSNWSATGEPDEKQIEECRRHLECALQIANVNQGLIDTAERGLRMFCSGTPPGKLLEYFHEQPIPVGKFLNDWAPRAPISLACRMLSDDFFYCSFLHNEFGDLVNWAVPNTSLINVLITGCQITYCQITHCDTNRCILELPRLLLSGSWRHAMLCPQTLSWRAAAF